MSVRFLTRVIAAACAAVLLVLSAGDRAALIAQQASATSRQGWASVVLPDGRVLVTGGMSGGRASTSAMLYDPQTRQTTPLAAGLVFARTGHTATVLPDGTVLIFGGLDDVDQPTASAELFDPLTETFSPLAIPSATPRAFHTATLLTDGTVLLTGGITADRAALATAERWDPASGVHRVAGRLSTPREGHSASLSADGDVLLTGGDARGAAPERYDPTTDSFVPALPEPNAPQPPAVAAAIPDNGAVDVPTDTRVAMRFATPMQTSTLGETNVRLLGAEGAVAATIVVAEGGRLLFVRPFAPLNPLASYVLAIEGATDVTGAAMPSSRVEFTTAALPTGAAGGANGASGFESPWRRLPPLRAAPGVTAIAGQVLLLDGQPLANVTLEVEEHTVRTDRTGRFLVEVADLSGRSELVIDGRSASTPGRVFGVFEAGIAVRAAETNVLPYTIWMPRIDTAHAVTIPSPTSQRDTVITTPQIPGLELHIPAGTVIRDHDGNIAREVSITPIPVEQPPFPLPADVYVPIYFTVQPGGGYLYATNGAPAGARLFYPNYRNEPAGKAFDFWHYDPENRGWYVYGQGAVAANRAQIIPNAGVEIYEFTGAMVADPSFAPAEGPQPCNECQGGDPVDLGTGLFVMRNTDLYLPDVIPIDLTRTYRTRDGRSRPFGVGATHPYEMFMVGNKHPYTYVDVILPDGGRMHYDRISAGTEVLNAVYEHVSSPSPFYKSRIQWNGLGWNLTLVDGTVYIFPEAEFAGGPNEAALIGIRDRFGNQLTISRPDISAFGSPVGNITRITSPSGRFIDFTYDAGDRIKTATDNTGRVVRYDYDTGGRLTKVTDPAGGMTEYTWDTSGRMKTVKNPRNIVALTNDYDSNSRVIKQTLADNSYWQFAYTLNGAQVTQTDVTDPRGFVRRVTFNPQGYWTTDTRAVSEPEQRTYTVVRDSTNQVITEIIDPLLRHTSIAYNASGGITTLTRLANTAQPETTTAIYQGPYNLVTGIVDPLNHQTTFGYDMKGALTSITDPLGHQVTLAANAAGRTVMETNAAGTTLYGYQGGQLASVTNPLGFMARRFLDGGGRALSQTDALGRTTQMEYDVLNRPVALIDPLQGRTEATFDGNGNVLSVRDARGGLTSFAYDVMDRIATRTDPLQLSLSYAYDFSGNLAQVTDRKGQVTTFDFDALNRPAHVEYNDGREITYTWDAVDRLTQVVDTESGTTTFAYDALDRLTSETSLRGTINYTYDAAGRRSTMTVTGQPTVTYTYDDADRLTEITRGGTTVGFAYDAADRRTQMTMPNGVTVDYTYNAASQLTGLTYKVGGNTIGTLTYAYDGNGRRTEVSGSFARTRLPLPLASASYNAANQLTQWDGMALSYDLNGNLVTQGGRSYTWDARDHLAAVDGGATASFLHDSFGRRISRTAGGVTTGYLYDGVDSVQELNGSTPVANQLHGVGVDEVLQRDDASGVRTLLLDALGSTLALLDPTGAIQTEYAYGPFGATTQSGSASANPAQYTGRENDGSGLYYYRGRYYSPTLQRFVSQDPLGFGGSDPNLYAYVRNDPANFIDPLGLLANNSWLDALQTGLDLGGLIPGFGEPFDLINAGISVARGDSIGAGLSMAAMLPIGGQLSTAAKAGRRFIGTPNGKLISVPGKWALREADNAKGLVCQRVGATGNRDMIRIMDPTPQYPDGYVRRHNQHGQPVDPAGRPGDRASTHIPLTYEGPLVWP
jgi:RHS repeat-associated protein